MWQKILQNSSFFLSLLQFDRDLAEQCRIVGCSCGGKLHSARYRRKPRGGPDDLPREFELRESFCCAEEGCRRRTTPPSLRFLGRRVYLGAVVVLVSALLHGVTEKRAKAIREFVGVDQQTLNRWREWWKENFTRTRLWRSVRARFVPAVDISKLPASLLERFGQPSGPESLLAVLRLLAPLTAGSNCAMDI